MCDRRHHLIGIVESTFQLGGIQLQVLTSHAEGQEAAGRTRCECSSVTKANMFGRLDGSVQDAQDVSPTVVLLVGSIVPVLVFVLATHLL